MASPIDIMEVAFEDRSPDREEDLKQKNDREKERERERERISYGINTS